jgi:hypothetical protein
MKKMMSFLFTALFFPVWIGAACAPKQDEEVVLFPTDAVRREDGRWDVPVHAWIFELEKDGVVRSGFLDLFRAKNGLEKDIRDERLRPFMADNERGKRLTLTGPGASLRLPSSGENGHAEAVWTVEAAGDAWGYRVAGCPDDARRFEGTARLVPPEGLSVISDIDDTIKISEVRDRRALMANTFSRPFQAVPDMAGLYRRWAGKGAVFHYLSASPWQLFDPLNRFLAKEGFPAGSLSLKMFRWKDRTFWDLFQDPGAYKIPLISGFFARYPRRRFILVGDDGERDPEIYGEIARLFPGQIEGIYIRRTTADGMDRFDEAFKGVPRERWKVFTSPMEVMESQ